MIFIGQTNAKVSHLPVCNSYTSDKSTYSTVNVLNCQLILTNCMLSVFNAVNECNFIPISHWVTGNEATSLNLDAPFRIMLLKLEIFTHRDNNFQRIWATVLATESLGQPAAKTKTLVTIRRALIYIGLFTLGDNVYRLVILPRSHNIFRNECILKSTNMSCGRPNSALKRN